MITSVMVMLELPNFGHMTTFTICFESHDKNLLVVSRTEIMTSQSLYQNAFILRRRKVANFANIIKISTKKVKRIGNYVLECDLYLHFFVEQNLLIFGGKMLMSAELNWYFT